jgi:hypothetical protein
MKKTLFYLSAKYLVGSCALAPIGSHYERAQTIQKGDLQVSGNIERYDGLQDGNYQESNYNYGGVLGYGICDKFDLKLRYQRMVGFDEVYGEDEPAKHNFFSISPKYMLIDRKLSVKLPLNWYHSAQEENIVFAIAPAVLGTLPISENFDLTGGIQYQHPFEEAFDGFFGLTFGIGASSNMDVWSIRPEFGWQSTLKEGDGSYFNYGLAFIYNFDLGANK